MVKVYLGGTGGKDKTTWRDDLKDLLMIDYFDPQSLIGKKNEAIQKAIQREECNYYLCVITPRTETNWTFIANIVEIVVTHPNKAIFCYIDKDLGAVFTQHQRFSVLEISHIVSKHGGRVFDNLNDLANFLNN